MIIAEEKKQTNIAEYLIYMFQIEDLIRSYKFDINKIEENIIKKFDRPDNVKNQIKDWYVNLIIMMQQEKITTTGHLKFINNLLKELDELHQKLLLSKDEIKYQELYKWAMPNIMDFRDKLSDKTKNDVSVCLHALYGLLLMRLKKREISKETVQAMSTFSNLMALLSKRFKEYKGK